MHSTKSLGRLIYCHSSAPEAILGDVVFQLDRGLTIGKAGLDNDADLGLTGRGISRRHAEIRSDKGRIWLKSVGTFDDGVRRYAHRLRRDDRIDLYRFDYFSLPGEGLGEPEPRYVFLFINLAKTSGLHYSPLMLDPLDAYRLKVFGTGITLEPQIYQLFECLHSRPGQFVSYEQIAHKLWPGTADHGRDQHLMANEGDTINSYLNRLRSALAKWPEREQFNKPDTPAQILFQQRAAGNARARLCLDDVLPALENQAINPLITEAYTLPEAATDGVDWLYRTTQ